MATSPTTTDGATDSVATTLSDLSGTATPVTDSVSNTASETISPITDTLGDAAGDVVAPIAEPLAKTVGDAVAPIAEPVGHAIGETLKPAADTVASIVGTTKSVTDPIMDTAAPIVDATKPVIDTVADTVAPLVDTAKPVISPITNWVGAVTEAVIAPVTSPITPIIGETNKPITDTVTPIVGDAIKPIVDTVTTPIAPVLDATKPVVGPVTSPIAPVVDAIKPVVGTVTAPVTPIADVTNPVGSVTAPVGEAPFTAPVSDKPVGEVPLAPAGNALPADGATAVPLSSSEQPSSFWAPLGESPAFYQPVLATPIAGIVNPLGASGTSLVSPFLAANITAEAGAAPVALSNLEGLTAPSSWQVGIEQASVKTETTLLGSYLERLSRSLVGDGLTTRLTNLLAEAQGLLNWMLQSFPAGAMPAPAGGVSGGSSSSSIGGSGFDWGVLALLAMLLLSGKLLWASREFLKPNSVLELALERPG